jgi:crossover junction endodeoxyribonuclease RuvC
VTDSVRVLGIDPGSLITGFGVIDISRSASVWIASGAIRVLGESLPDKLGCIFGEVSALVAAYRPEIMAVERVFVHRNVDAALKLGQARGAAICAGVAQGLSVAEYAPREIKQAVVGTGSAAKEQVQHMVARLLHLGETPGTDEADALAVAICHGHQLRPGASPALTVALRGARRRR